MSNCKPRNYAILVSNNLMNEVEKLLKSLPGRDKAGECSGEGVVWDRVTKRYTRVCLGPKGASPEERGIFVEGDFGRGEMPYSDTPMFRISCELLKIMLSETEKRPPTERDIIAALSGRDE